MKFVLLAGVFAHEGERSHKYKAEFNPPDETFPPKRLNEEVLIPKGKKLNGLLIIDYYYKPHQT